MAKVTLDSLLEMRLKKESKVVTYDSKECGGEIEVVKKTLRETNLIIDKGDTTTSYGSLKMYSLLIFAHCPLFQDKELKKSLKVGEPWEVVPAVFNENLHEIKELVDVITELYHFDEVRQEVDDIKN